MKHVLRILILIAAPSYALGGEIYESEAICAKNWETLSSVNEGQQEELLSQWLKVKGECKNSGLYYYRLGGIYFSIGEIIKAEDSYNKALELPTLQKRYIQMALANIQVQKIFNQIGDQTENIELAERSYLSLIDEYKNYGGGYIQYSGLLLMMKRYKEAVQIATEGLKLEESSNSLTAVRSYGYRNLAIAYRNLGVFEVSVEAFKKAYSLDSSIVADLDLMLSASKSYAKTGDTKMAKGLLFELYDNNPSVKENPQFQKAVEELKNNI